MSKAEKSLNVKKKGTSTFIALLDAFPVTIIDSHQDAYFDYPRLGLIFSF
jgi:hypothetical protein